MPLYTDVVASRIEKYRAQLARENGNDADINMAMFWIAIGGLVDAAFSGGGGGGGSTSASTIAQGVDRSIDINTILQRLANIDANQLNQSSVVAAIQTAADIDALIARLVAIDDKIPSLGAGTIAVSTSVNIASDQIVNVRDRSTTTPIAQTTIALAANGTNQFIIPANARSLTICVTSGSLVHYTEDGSVPTAANCWFAGGSKEIWDYAVPAGATLRLLAVSAATVSIQVRV